MSLLLQPIEGIRVDRDSGPIQFPGFVLIHSSKVLEYFSSRTGKVVAEHDFMGDIESHGDTTYICVERSLSVQRRDYMPSLECELLNCAAILCISYALHFDLGYMPKLRHESFMRIGNISIYYDDSASDIGAKVEMCHRGFCVDSINPPITINQPIADIVSSHPLLQNLYQCCALDPSERTEMMRSLLNAARLLYLSLSAHYAEAQLLTAVSSIDALMYPLGSASNEKSKKTENEGRSFPPLKPKYLPIMLLGESNLERLAAFSWPSSSTKVQHPALSIYQKRNDVAHNGAKCNDEDACNAFRIAFRVLLCASRYYLAVDNRETLINALVHESLPTMQSTNWPQNGKHTYPWLDSGMPDLLPFITSRFYAESGIEGKVHTLETLATCSIYISERRGVSTHIALSAIRNSDFTGCIKHTDDDVIALCTFMMGTTVRCKTQFPISSRSPLGFH